MQKATDFDLLFLLRILESGEKIKLYSAVFSDAIDFFESDDQKHFNACLSLLAHIGEQANKVSDETKKQYGSLDWEKMYGYRNRIVHDYTGIDKFITFEIIQNAIPELIESIGDLIVDSIRTGRFNSEDIELSKKSLYLRHIDFKRFG
jgi:uncharacterized protein with HEPN domain